MNQNVVVAARMTASGGLSHPQAEVTDTFCPTDIYLSAGDLSPGPHACEIGPLPTEPSSQLALVS